MAKTTTINNAKEIIGKYPKAITSLKNWLEGELQAPAEDDLLELILTHNPRILYDFFDEKGIYVSIDKYYSKNTEKEPNFNWGIEKGDSDYESEEEYDDRPAVEEAAFIKAFEILDNEG